MDRNSTVTEIDPSALSETPGAETVPCAACGSTEPPDASGLCPVKTCRCFRRGNSVAAIHDGRAKLTPTDFAARDALVERLFTERGGRVALDIVSQLRVEDYATAAIQLGKVTRRLEMLGAVSTAGNERKSLVATYTTFSARVERLAVELPPPVAHAAQSVVVAGFADLQNLTDEELADRAVALAARLGRAVDRPAAPVPASAADVGPSEANAAGPDDEPDPAATAAPSGRESAEPGADTAARDAWVKTNNPAAWRAIHYNDADEIARRDAEAVEIMLHQIGRPML